MKQLWFCAILLLTGATATASQRRLTAKDRTWAIGAAKRLKGLGLTLTPEATARLTEPGLAPRNWHTLVRRSGPGTVAENLVRAVTTLRLKRESLLGTSLRPSAGRRQTAIDVDLQDTGQYRIALHGRQLRLSEFSMLLTPYWHIPVHHWRTQASVELAPYLHGDKIDLAAAVAELLKQYARPLPRSQAARAVAALPTPKTPAQKRAETIANNSGF
jgi:hypothetical protein